MATALRYTPAIQTDEVIRKGLAAAHGLKAEGMIGPPCLLTYPEVDLEGDFVAPDGGRWVPRPFVNLDHMHPVGWAKSLPSMYSMQVNGETYNVPVGQTKFFKSLKDIEGADLNIRDAKGDPTGKHYDPKECLHLAKQVHKLVNLGLMNGTSLEFKSLHANPIGKSALRGRTAWEHTDWIGLGWAHTAQPVNPGAQTIDDIEGRLCKALGDPHPLIRKSFAINPPKRSSVVGGYVPTKERPMARVTKKAMPEDEEDMGEEYAADDDLGEGDSVPSPGEDELPEDGDDMGDGPTPTVAAFYQGAQSIADVCQMIDAAMAKSEHLKGKKFAAGICADLMKLSAKVQGMGDKIAQELKGGHDEPDGDEDGEDMDGDGDGEEADAPDMDDEGGVIPKSFAGFRAKRLTAKDFGPPIKKAQRKDAHKFVEIPKDQWEAIQEALKELNG